MTELAESDFETKFNPYISFETKEKVRYKIFALKKKIIVSQNEVDCIEAYYDINKGSADIFKSLELTLNKGLFYLHKSEDEIDKFENLSIIQALCKLLNFKNGK